MSKISPVAMPRRGLIRINTAEAIASTWAFTCREIGAAWLAYLNGEDSPFAEFCTYKERRPSVRPPWSEWKETRKRIFARDGYRCTYCGADDLPLECDHIVPVALGGGHDDDNLTTACQPCNARKGARTADQFRVAA